MKILVACESSGEVRDAFIALGHDAISCDYEPSEKPGPHIIGDATPWLRKEWDLVIAHPPCTYLANSGVSWLFRQPGRFEKLNDAAAFFKLCLNANAPLVAVENPIMHKYAKELVGRAHNFTIQPWEFGHGDTKRTAFWTKNLPPLIATQYVEGREQRVLAEPPGPDRQRNRSRTYPGIAAAMAKQWSRVNYIQGALF